MERIYKLLIVDDDAYTREKYHDFFTQRGFQVETANDGEEGLKNLRQGEFDVALVEVKLPKMDGIAMIRQAQEEGVDTSYAILSGSSDKQEVIDALNVGVEAWFEKSSVDDAELHQRVVRLAQVIPDETIRKILANLPDEV